MRTLLAIFLLLPACFADEQFIFSRSTAFKPRAASGSEPTYLIRQGFEGTGYDNSESWTEAGTGTVDEDSTSPAIAGSQSLRITVAAQTGSTFGAFSAQTVVYGFFRMRITTALSAGRTLVSWNSSTTTRGVLILGSDSKIQVTASGGTQNGSSDAVPLNTDIYVWFEATQSSGANDGTAKAGWSTDGIKPTLSASGAKSCASVNGTYTSTWNRLYIGLLSSSTCDLSFDTVRVAADSIPDNPAP